MKYLHCCCFWLYCFHLKFQIRSTQQPQKKNTEVSFTDSNDKKKPVLPLILILSLSSFFDSICLLITTFIIIPYHNNTFIIAVTLSLSYLITTSPSLDFNTFHT